MQFDEYKDPEDIYERFKVGDAMNELAACSCMSSFFTSQYYCGDHKHSGISILSANI